MNDRNMKTFATKASRKKRKSKIKITNKSIYLQEEGICESPAILRRFLVVDDFAQSLS